MSARLTLICSAATMSLRVPAFPVEDEPLDARGEREAHALHGAFEVALRAFVSPMRRARQTAQALGLDALVAPELRDADCGRWAGRTLAEIAANEPEALASWMRDPHAAPHGGESVADVAHRTAAWLDEWKGSGRTIVVTHPAVVRALVLHVLDAPLTAHACIDAAPLSRVQFTYDGRSWKLRLHPG